MDVFEANNLSKKRTLKGSSSKISQSNIIKTHVKHQKKLALKDTKPECIFCNFKSKKKK